MLQWRISHNLCGMSFDYVINTSTISTIIFDLTTYTWKSPAHVNLHILSHRHSLRQSMQYHFYYICYNCFYNTNKNLSKINPTHQIVPNTSQSVISICETMWSDALPHIKYVSVGLLSCRRWPITANLSWAWSKCSSTAQWTAHWLPSIAIWSTHLLVA